MVSAGDGRRRGDRRGEERVQTCARRADRPYPREMAFALYITGQVFLPGMVMVPLRRYLRLS